MKLIHTRLASSVALVMFGLSNATAQTTTEPAQVTAFGGVDYVTGIHDR